MAKGRFALGLVVGGLAGLAAGYYVSRTAEPGDEGALRRIDLTPAIELKNDREKADSGRATATKRPVKRASSAEAKEGDEE